MGTARAAQATLVGGRVFVFGGEDSSRRPLGELHILDPAACSWQPAATSGAPPSPRRRAARRPAPAPAVLHTCSAQAARPGCPPLLVKPCVTLRAR